MTSSLISFATEVPEHTNELPFAPVWFGVIALLVFLGLLATLWGFRNTAARMVDPRHDSADHHH